MTMTSSDFRTGFTHEVFADGAEYVEEVKRHVVGCELAAVDIETTGLLPPPATLAWGKKRGVEAFIVSLSISVTRGQGEDLWTGVVTYPSEDTIREAMRALRYLAHVVAHNALFEFEWIGAVAGELPPITDDTRDLARLAFPQMPTALKELVISFYADDYGIGVKPRELYAAIQEDAARVWEYNALDTWYTAKLYYLLRDNLDDRDEVLYREVHKPLMQVLAKLNEAPALWIDKERAEESLQSLTHDADDALSRFNRSVPDKGDGTAWNPRSPQQLMELLYRRLDLPQQRTRDGKVTANADALAALRNEHEAVAALEDYRVADKLAGMVSKYCEYASFGEEGDRLPAHYAARTVTGRLACDRENLQQIPRDPRVRGVFGAPKGRVLITADFSQIELRLAAAVSGDETMIQTYRDGADLHRRTAAGLAGCSEEAVTKEQRTAAKAANFGLLYGMGAPGFRAYAASSYGLRMSEREAYEQRAKFFATYPRLREWHEKTRRELATSLDEYGCAWLTLPGGQDAAWPEYRHARARVERQAINAQIQGLAATIMFRALIELEQLIELAYTGEARLVGTVHDSALIEVSEEAAEDLIPQVKETMEDPHLLLEPLGLQDIPVPLVADIEHGDRWR